MKSLFKKKKRADGSSATPSPEPAAHPHAGQYRSETVERVPGTTTAPPQLVIGDSKPPVPPFGGEGLHANTVYEVRRRSPSPPARKKGAQSGDRFGETGNGGRREGEIILMARKVSFFAKLAPFLICVVFARDYSQTCLFFRSRCQLWDTMHAWG